MLDPEPLREPAPHTSKCRVCTSTTEKKFTGDGDGHFTSVCFSLPPFFFSLSSQPWLCFLILEHFHTGSNIALPPNLYAEILTPACQSVSLFGDGGLYRDPQVQMRSSMWVLIQYEWNLY